jgi:hypothetical protein
MRRVTVRWAKEGSMLPLSGGGRGSFGVRIGFIEFLV